MHGSLNVPNPTISVIDVNEWVPILTTGLAEVEILVISLVLNIPATISFFECLLRES